MYFPRLNALAYWLFPVGGALIWAGLPDAGWSGYAPLSVISRAPELIFGFLAYSARNFVNSRCDQFRRHDLQAPSSRSNVPEHVTLRLDDVGKLVLDDRGNPGSVGRFDHASLRSKPRNRLLHSCAWRRPINVAAHVLVLRPSRSLHHDNTSLRPHLRNYPNNVAQAHLRIWNGSWIRDNDRCLRFRGLGTPHVHVWPFHHGPIPIHGDDTGHRRSLRHQSVQLAGHDDRRKNKPQGPDEIRNRVHSYILLRRGNRRLSSGNSGRLLIP